MLSHFAVFGLGTPELLLILGIVVLLFGAKKLPELSRGIGDSIQELRKGIKNGTSSNEDQKKQSKRPETKDSRS